MNHQLDLFTEPVSDISQEVSIEREVQIIETLSEKPQHPENEFDMNSVRNDIMPTIKQGIVSYEVGDIVKILMPSVEEDSEAYWWMYYYFSHLKNAKGRISRVLTYSRLQYEIEFDVKHEDNRTILYHEHLTWISSHI